MLVSIYCCGWSLMLGLTECQLHLRMLCPSYVFCVCEGVISSMHLAAAQLSFVRQCFCILVQTMLAPSLMRYLLHAAAQLFLAKATDQKPRNVITAMCTSLH